MTVPPAPAPCPHCAASQRAARLAEAREQAAQRRAGMQHRQAQAREAVLAAALLAAPAPRGAPAARAPWWSRLFRRRAPKS